MWGRQPEPPSAPRTKAEQDSALAEAAWRRGEALARDGDMAAAAVWLDRAGRIAPDDDMVALSRARVKLATGDPAGAAALFERVCATCDVREVWLGLALARLNCGAGDAAAALARLLSGHRLPGSSDVPDWASLADALAVRAGAPGWCGLRADDTLLVRPAAGRRGALRVTADGVVLKGRVAPPGVAELHVSLGGTPLLGSPLDVARMRRVEGVVRAWRGGLEGWAWLPGDADREPDLIVQPVSGGEALRLRARDDDVAVVRPLTRPRRFTLGAAELAAVPGLAGVALHVRGPDGRDLAGSPLDPGQEARAAAAAAAAVARALPVLGGAAPAAPSAGVPWLPVRVDVPATPASAPPRPRRLVAVVVPAYRNAAATLACLEAVFATVPARTEIVVVDDASPEPALRAALDGLAAAGRIRLIRHAANRGFPAAANAGLRAAAALPGARDVVLLNSDTLPTAGWLARLRAVVHAAPDIGAACPLSNDASILGYPDPAKPAAAPQAEALAALAALAGRVHADAAVDIPTAVGFCMYIRRECLLQTGLLREDVFGQGYGEENDFCLRARQLGWRHVAAPGAYVAHVGAASFGAARTVLLERNLDILERLHPGYRDLIAGWQRRDPLAEARRALDLARWSARPRAPGGTVALVTHDSGGGVERAVRVRIAALAAERRGAVVLRPLVDPQGTAARRYLPGLCRVDDGVGGHYPNLVFRVPEDLPALTALLAAERPAWLELHHLLGHDPAIAGLAGTLGVPLELRVHDYALVCAQITLVGAGRRYCGEPAVSGCDVCVADLDRSLEENIAPAALRARSAALVAAARRVVAPSDDTATRLRRYFPAARLAVAAHEDDDALPPPAPPPPPATASRPRRVGVIGGIGASKGYDTLLACARDAARRDLALSFTVIGHTEDDERLLASGRVFITGPYREADAVALIRQHTLHLAFLPSVWPETWCYTLGEALRAGLCAAVFDIGAQAERVRRTGRGWVLPLGLPAQAINNALLALPPVARDECAVPANPVLAGGVVAAGIRSGHPRSTSARS